MQSSNSIMKFWNNLQIIKVVMVVPFMLASCEDFLKTDLSKAKVEADKVFSNNVTATSAVTGIYANFLTNNHFASGGLRSVSVLSALAADELNYYRTTTSFKEFQENNLSTDNANVESLWNSMYNSIYQANSILENLDKSEEVTTDVKAQLQGEAYFIRAFCNFYLLNLYGNTPLITTTDYRKNSVASRSSEATVYDQIVSDLLAAQNLLKDEYITIERVRPNKACATAILARVYMYRTDWENAESAATAVLTDAKYSLEPDLDKVFIKNSREAIWQLRNNYNTNEARLFILSGPPNTFKPLALTNSLVNTFEAGDLRKDNWIGQVTTGTTTYYYPFKYKNVGGPDSNPPVPLSEYSMVLRAAEQYLIRAEARTRLGNLPGAIQDLDMIRKRAGLSLISETNPGIAQADLLLAVETQRQLELFTEWGHRFLDLKRTARIDAVLGSAKVNWIPEHALLPIPQDELDKNPRLAPQNPGY